MQGLRERNTNIARPHSKKTEKDRTKPLAVPSHATSHARGSPEKEEEKPTEPTKSNRKVGLDDEEMLFLAKRCLAEELMTRPSAPAVLAELSVSTPARATMSAQAAPVLAPSVPEEAVPAPAPLARPMRRSQLFQLHRLGVGLIVLKFGWIWVSCGGLIVADSVFCTGDIAVLVFRRLKEHMWQVGGRLHTAARDSMKLFTDNDD